MKKLLLLSGLIMMTNVLMSCQSDAEVYSCNKEINQWVCDNLVEIRSMSRAEWRHLDERIKRPSYRAFTQQQKIAFWQDKIRETLEMDWSEEEKKHLNLLLKFINDNPVFFAGVETLSDEKLEQYEVFVYKWIEYAKSHLGWDMQLIASITASGNRLMDKSGKIQISSSRAMVKSSGEQCDCEIDQYIRWCATMDCEKSRSGCEANYTGCGFLLQYPCDGTCGGV